MRIGKLENNQLISSFTVVYGLINTTIFIGENWISNPTVEQMESIGYKSIIEGIERVPQEGYYLSPIYTEDACDIIISFEELVIPISPTAL